MVWIPKLLELINKLKQGDKMKIKLLTTEKKLTKSILNQIPLATLKNMKEDNLLGFILNSREDHYKVILIERDNIYSILPIYDWKKVDWDSSVHENCIYRYTPKRTIYKSFDSEEKRDEWFKTYSKIKDIQLKQIYI